VCSVSFTALTQNDATVIVPRGSVMRSGVRVLEKSVHCSGPFFEFQYFIIIVATM